MGGGKGLLRGATPHQPHRTRNLGGVFPTADSFRTTDDLPAARKPRREEEDTLAAHTWHQEHEKASTSHPSPSSHSILQTSSWLRWHWGPAGPLTSSFGKPPHPTSCHLYLVSLGWNTAPANCRKPPALQGHGLHLCPTVPSPGSGAGHRRSSVLITEWGEGRGREEREGEQKGRKEEGTSVLRPPRHPGREAKLCPEGEGSHRRL